jgi:hypothetical protein
VADVGGRVDIEERAQRSLVRRVCLALLAGGLALVLLSSGRHDPASGTVRPAVTTEAPGR